MSSAAARNAFNAFDKKSEERIKVGDIEATMRKLGHNIKSGWLEKIESTIDTEGASFTTGIGTGPASRVFTCIGALGTPQPNGAPRWKVFTGFPILQLIFAKVIR